MKKKHSSVEGFVVRRPNNQLGVSKAKRHNSGDDPTRTFIRPSLHNGESKISRNLGKPQVGLGLGRADVSESLKGLDEKIQPAKKMSRRELRKLKKLSKKKHPIRKFIFKFILFSIISCIVIGGGYMGYKVLNASHNVVQGNILDIFKPQMLKEDKNGRSSFLILGTSEDDNGHSGADLTDSMLVVSINQTDKNIYMFSVPRDLYVEYGTACPSGYSGKINAYYSCSNSGTTPSDEQDRLTKTQKLVGDVFGVEIQYSIHVNHTVIKQVVDAIGGVDVDIQGSNGDPGVYDRNFDWRCNFTCYYVKYTNGVHHLDGIHALFLAMARGDIAPTYGLGNSNFDREKNQQKILIAMRDKALTAGTLTNLGAVTKLIDALGDNLRTNIQTSEIQTLMKIASEVKPTNVNSISLVDGDDTVMGTGMYYGASVVMPKAGMFKYSDIQNYIAKKISSDPVVREAAPVVVLNGSGVAGYGKTKSEELIAKGYTVSLVDTAPEGTYATVEIYQIGTSSPETAKKLSLLYGVTLKTTKPPVTVTGDIQFVIIYGVAPATPNQ
jgi:LCP family protein required for cell wall assembly